MRITVFGATGNVGSRVVAEALSRGHEVTAIMRDPTRLHGLNASANIRTGDAGNSEDVARLSAGQDLVITATRPPSGKERELVAITESLFSGLTETKVRLLIVGGAGGLTVPGDSNALVVDDPRYVGPAWRGIALACTEQLEVCRVQFRANWTYLSPPAMLMPGERTGTFRVGKDELLVDSEGNSSISIEDFAVALIDEAEQPKHPQARFTVAYPPVFFSFGVSLKAAIQKAAILKVTNLLLHSLRYRASIARHENPSQ